jgi:hypothetical protein
MAQCMQPWPAAQAQAAAQAGAQKRGAASSPSTKADWRRVAKRRRKTVDAETKRLVTGCMQCLCHSSLMPYVEAVGASYLVRQPVRRLGLYPPGVAACHASSAANRMHAGAPVHCQCCLPQNHPPHRGPSCNAVT